LDIQAKLLGTPVNQLGTQVSQQPTIANQLGILISLLPILHNLEDILKPILSILVQEVCHIQLSLLKGCLVCFTQQILINNSMQANQSILLLAQHSHPQLPHSTLL